jgi:hypothetical protein
VKGDEDEREALAERKAGKPREGKERDSKPRGGRVRAGRVGGERSKI